MLVAKYCSPYVPGMYFCCFLFSRHGIENETPVSDKCSAGKSDALRQHYVHLKR